MEPIHDGPLAGRTVLVTGGTAGIGKATALGLATMGARVGITGRDRVRSEAAAREIRAVGGQVDVFVGDLSVQSEVRRLATKCSSVFSDRCVGQQRRRVLEHPAPDRRRARAHLRPEPPRAVPAHPPAARPAELSAPARVVTVSSNAQAQGRIDFDDLQGMRSYSGARAYSQSKLANVLFSYELARRLHGTSVTANALHPGVVSTPSEPRIPPRCSECSFRSCGLS